MPYGFQEYSAPSTTCNFGKNFSVERLQAQENARVCMRPAAGIGRVSDQCGEAGGRVGRVGRAAFCVVPLVQIHGESLGLQLVHFPATEHFMYKL